PDQGIAGRNSSRTMSRAWSSRRVLLSGFGAARREAARSRPRVWLWFDHIGPIDSAMPSKTHTGRPVSFFATAAREWRRRDRRKLSSTSKHPGLPAGRAESFPVSGELCLRATTATTLCLRSSSRLLASGSGALRCLPSLRPLLQIEVLVPCALPGRLARCCCVGRLGRRHLGPLLASLHPEIPSAKTGGNRTIPPLLDPYVGPSEPSADILARDPVGLGAQREGVIGVHPALLHVAENRGQVVMLLQRPVSIVGARRHHRKRRVDPRQKFGFQVVVGLLQGGHSRYTHALHQPVLRRQESALHPPFRLRAVRRYPGDRQLLQCPADLRRWQFFPALPQSTAVSFRFLRSLKDRRFVGVERQWPLVLLQIAFQQVHVLHGGVAGHKSREPPAGRIVDHVDQQNLFPAPFQPVVRARIPLHQFAKSAPPRTPFMDLLEALLPRLPQFGPDHPLPHRLPAHSNVVLLGQVLRGQRRPEPPVHWPR